MTPQERQRKIESYGCAYQKLVAGLQQFPKEMWKFKPSADEWSIHELIVHIANSEVSSYIACRKLIAEPGSTVLGSDQMKWSKVLPYHAASTEDSLELFRWLRECSYKLLRSLPEATWSNTLERPGRGTMTFERWLDAYERHIPEHLNQMQQVYDAWKAQNQAR